MSEDLADTPTPKPQPGEWTLTAPDGRQWHADSPIRCVSAEQRERVPASIALARIMREVDDEPATNKDSLTVAGRQQGEARPARAEAFKLAVELKLTLVPHYFDLAVAEGREGRDHDTPAGEAGDTYNAICQHIDRLAALATQAAPEAQAEPQGMTIQRLQDCLTAKNEEIATLRRKVSEAQAEPAGEPVAGEATRFVLGWAADRESAAASGERDTLRALLREAREALAESYDVTGYPADGKTKQDAAIARIDAALADGGAK